LTEIRKAEDSAIARHQRSKRIASIEIDAIEAMLLQRLELLGAPDDGKTLGILAGSGTPEVAIAKLRETGADLPAQP
jgi:hypothetical protein